MRNIIGVILGGGRGTRLYPLTKYRAKPAVPLAGKYRLVDIPLSNCINSGLEEIFVLTQYHSASLTRHIQNTYKFDQFSSGFVNILAAEQTLENERWYQGTADAVRQNLQHIFDRPREYVFILPGDTLFSMDLREMLARHITSKADLTIALHPAHAHEVPAFGIATIDENGRVTDQIEKPSKEDAVPYAVTPGIRKKFNITEQDGDYLASMGLYLFNSECLERLLANVDLVDFGSQILPEAIRSVTTHAHIFKDYWKDIGTIDAFYHAHLDFVMKRPLFDFFSEENPVFTHSRFLPGSKIGNASVAESIIAEGCRINKANIRRSVVGIRTIIGKQVEISESIIMGADEYEPGAGEKKSGLIRVGIGDYAKISKAIIDKNARIGDGVVIENRRNLDNFDGENYYIRSGIVIVPKNTTIQPGTVI